MAVATGGEVTLVDDSENEWFEDYAEDADEIQIEEYDITASPNDFNVVTIYNFLEAGSVRIPGFQRNYVWDLGRASKLIKSLRAWAAGSANISLRIRSQRLSSD